MQVGLLGSLLFFLPFFIHVLVEVFDLLEVSPRASQYLSVDSVKMEVIVVCHGSLNCTQTLANTGSLATSRD